jgi:hypothetical protein
MVEFPLVPGMSDYTTKLFHLPNNRRRLAMKKIWIVSAAALPGWLQVFASPHFSRLPSLFYLEDSPRTSKGTTDSLCEVFYLGDTPRPPAPNNKTIRMFRCARSGCRTPPPRILHLLRSMFPTLIVRRSLRLNLTQYFLVIWFTR